MKTSTDDCCCFLCGTRGEQSSARPRSGRTTSSSSSSASAVVGCNNHWRRLSSTPRRDFHPSRLIVRLLFHMSPKLHRRRCNSSPPPYGSKSAANPSIKIRSCSLSREIVRVKNQLMWKRNDDLPLVYWSFARREKKKINSKREEEEEEEKGKVALDDDCCCF